MQSNPILATLTVLIALAARSFAASGAETTVASVDLPAEVSSDGSSRIDRDLGAREYHAGSGTVVLP